MNLSPIFHTVVVVVIFVVVVVVFVVVVVVVVFVFVVVVVVVVVFVVVLLSLVLWLWVVLLLLFEENIFTPIVNFCKTLESLSHFLYPAHCILNSNLGHKKIHKI